MIEIVGLMFLGLWAAGRARQTGRNPYVWSLAPIAVYIVIYAATYVVLNYVLHIVFTPGSPNGNLVVYFITSAVLLPISFVASKLILDWYFGKSVDGEKGS